jgi:hypothetical protein
MTLVWLTERILTPTPSKNLDGPERENFPGHFLAVDE